MASFRKSFDDKGQSALGKGPGQLRGPGAAPLQAASSRPMTPGLTSASEHRMHEVAAGETLAGLALRYYGDASKSDRIFRANREQLADPDRIRVGQRLKIPLL